MQYILLRKSAFQCLSFCSKFVSHNQVSFLNQRSYFTYIRISTKQSKSKLSKQKLSLTLLFAYRAQLRHRQTHCAIASWINFMSTRVSCIGRSCTEVVGSCCCRRRTWKKQKKGQDQSVLAQDVLNLDQVMNNVYFVLCLELKV